MNQPDVAASNAIANPTQKSGSLEIAIREFLAFKLGDEEYGMDILRVVNLRGVIVPNIGKQVVGMVVNGVSDVITLTPEQLRPVSEFLRPSAATTCWPSARCRTAC